MKSAKLYLPKRQADPDQVKALSAIRKAKEKFFALFLGMRVRKTKVIIDRFGELELEKKANDLCVIAPGGAYRTWEDALQLDLSEDLAGRILIHTWKSGGGVGRKRERLEFLKHKGPRALLMNIEALSRPGDARDFIIDYLDQNTVVTAIDECFPAGTMIDTPYGKVAIDKLKVGDVVSSTLTNQRIKTIIKNKSKVLTIKLSNGREIISTDNHPFFTDLGWVLAKNLEGRILYDKEKVHTLWEDNKKENLPFDDEERHREILREILFSEMEDVSTRNQSESFYRNSFREDASYSQSSWNNLQGCWLEQGNSNEGNFQTKINCILEKNRPHIHSSRRQWETVHKSTKTFIENAWQILGCRIPSEDIFQKRAWWLSNMLQSRHWQSKKEIGNRVRWSKPQCCESEIIRQEEGCQAEGIRVESVKIEEQRNPIDVFNIELEGNPHFFAEGVLVHNCTVIKNKSKRTDFVLKYVKPRSEYRYIMSGLPNPRSPMDMYYQFYFLDEDVLGFNSWYTFRAHVAFMKQQWFGGRSVMLINKEEGDSGFRPEAIKELRELIKPHSIRIPFNPLVDPTYEIREIEMTDEQHKHYASMRDFATTMISEERHVSATVVIAQIMRLHQILCGHTMDEEGNLVVFKENKTSSLMEMLEDYDGKAIIWCSYDHDIVKVSEALKEAYGERSVARFWGGNVATREDEEKIFKTKDYCRFEVATPDAGGRGRTWDMADLNTFYSSKDNLEHRDQAEHRPYAKDKVRGVAHVDLIIPNTVEVKILEALRKKINMAATINGDNYRQWLI